jgi:hypothetical protein
MRFTIRLLRYRGRQQAFTLAGFERVDGVDYAQSWLVSPL